MASAFDVGIEQLAGRTPAAGRVLPVKLRAKDPKPGAATFFLETFGCQMNDHDSEKVAGVLVSRGYRQVEKPSDASMILYNTCSIREKAAQKVFSRLGEFRGTSDAEKIIGVLGCVAQQEGEDIFKRAPWVSLVCGSASYRNLPEMLDKLEAGERRVSGLDNDTDETFETEITRRDNPFRAFLTTKRAPIVWCPSPAAQNAVAPATRSCAKSGNLRSWATRRCSYSGKPSIRTPIRLRGA